MIAQGERPMVDCVAAIPSRAISVAVSNPSPNKKPSGYICQLREIKRKIGLIMRETKPVFGPSKSMVSFE